MSSYYHFKASQAKKQACALFCLLFLGANFVWAQTTQLSINQSDPTQVSLQKNYDGTTFANITYLGTLSGIDSVHPNVYLQGSAAYLDPNVGGIKRIVVSYSIYGSDSAYYLPPQNDTLLGGILPKQLSILGTTIDSTKVYNGNTFVTLHLGTKYGVIGSDNVNVSAIARYDDPNVGDNKTVTVQYYLYGNTEQCSNYIAPTTATFTASITPLQVYATPATLEAVREYNGTTVCFVNDPGTISGILSRDTVLHFASAAFSDPNVGTNKMVSVSHFLYGPQCNNYSVIDTNSLYTASILPRTIIAKDGMVQLVKTHDGTNNAIVLVPAAATNIVGNESVVMTTTATYDSPNVGSGKTITMHFSISGIGDAANYAAPDDMIYSTNGKIVARVVLDSSYGLNGIVTDKGNYCQNDVVKMTCHITQGTPVYYLISFSPEARQQGFINFYHRINYNENDGTFDIMFPVPDKCKEGTYKATITIGNEANDEITVSHDFTVNMPNSYLVIAFNDVVSIDNRQNRFNTFQWYLNDVPIKDATKPYYQFSQTGSYSVVVNPGTPDEHKICPLYVEVSTENEKSLTTTPNPVINNTTIKLTGFEKEQHLLTIFNSYGTTVVRTTFNGDEYTLDMSTMPHGTYMINVDGYTTKTIKL